MATVIENRKPAVVLVSLPQLLRKHTFEPPAIPEKMVWTSSSLKLFRKCKRKFFWKYILKLHPKTKSSALFTGGHFHQALEAWYKGKRSDMVSIALKHQRDMQKHLDEYHDFYDQDQLDKLTQEIATFVGMTTGYAQTYESDRKVWTIHRESIEREFRIDFGRFFFRGKIDLVAWQKKHCFVVEHKTASRIGESYVQRLPLDTQVRAYVCGAQHLGLPVSEVLYDVVRKCQLRHKSNETADDFNKRIRLDYESRPEFYFFRENLRFARSDIEAFVYELHQTHKEFDYLIKNADVLNPREWLPNDATCDEYFRLCDFHQLCTTGLDRGTSLAYEQREEMHQELSGDGA